MTTLAPTVPGTASARPGRTTVHPVTFPRVVAAEWIKFRTVRSTVWTILVTVVAMVGINTLIAWGMSMAPAEAQGGPGTTSVVTLLSSGVTMAQLVVAVLGVLTVTTEYTTGMVRSSFAAVPRRLPTLAAKAIVLAAVTLVVSLVSMALSYVTTLPFHDALGATLDLSDGETLRMALGLPLYLVAVALLGLGFGALLRSSAGAIATVVGLLLVVENVFMLVPLRLFEVVSPFLPATAGARIMYDETMLTMIDTMSEGAVLTPWQGYGVMVAWVVVLLGAAAVLLRRRDA
ncbi:ABC transporter permease [Actinotalea ferrariae CF5-4]|uniref:ABC transporter permease n=1 Tax=Actinotalea ferrariae CF5-4 TaxID=948458 RepID=A0A021VQI8_9CELL|nr:ABC transporter permease subunit [Actinotalea ferrariae]EYR63378.1 ABC transporter permease [Actinotalea ferrariae CF5-4]